MNTNFIYLESTFTQVKNSYILQVFVYINENAEIHVYHSGTEQDKQNMLYHYHVTWSKQTVIKTFNHVHKVTSLVLASR